MPAALAGRLLVFMTSAALHAGAFALVSGGHAAGDRASAAVQTTLEVDVATEPAPALPPPEPMPAAPRSAAHVHAHASHTHAYAVHPAHDAHPHDSALVHVAAAPAAPKPETPAPDTPAPATPEKDVRTPAPHGAEAPRFVLRGSGSASGSAASPATAGVAPASGGPTRAARLTTSAPPRYPDDARVAGHEQDVALDLEVDERGVVVGARALRAAPYGLAEAAEEAARRFRFAPAEQQGVPVRTRLRWTVSFRLHD